MKRFEFKKKFIESELPPKNTDVYWIDTNENSTTKDILSIKSCVNGEWKSILGSGNSDSNTGSSNFVKLDEGVYFLQTENAQVVPNETNISLDIGSNDLGNNNTDQFPTWKDVYEYYVNTYADVGSSLANSSIIDDAKILSNLNDSYKSKFYFFINILNNFIMNVDFPGDINDEDPSTFDSYLKEMEPLIKFKTSYLKVTDGDQHKLGSCKIYVYCKGQGTVNELDIIMGTDAGGQFTISRTYIDTINLKKSLTYSLISAEDLANDEETSLTEIMISSSHGEDIYENQCVYNSTTNKIVVTGFDFMGWGSKTSKPVPMQYWVDKYYSTKSPEIGLYYRCTPTETPTEISDYLKSNSGVELSNLTVTKLYLPKYNKCFYLIDNTIDTDMGVGTGEFKECDISTKFDDNW